MDTNPPFELTTDGYTRAVLWLHMKEMFHLVDKELSVDGYSVVNLANNLYNKELNNEY